MDDLEKIKRRLERTPLSDLAELSNKSGVPFGTLQKLKYGTTKNPRFETVKLLTDHYDRAA